MRNIRQRVWNQIPEQSVYRAKHQTDVQIKCDRSQHPMNRHCARGERGVAKGVAGYGERGDTSGVAENQRSLRRFYEIKNIPRRVGNKRRDYKTSGNWSA